MKWLLRILPRPWLIRLSILARPLLRWGFKGNTFTDPIDQSQYRKFLPYGYVKLRKNALCPGTLSLERHRLLWLYLERNTSFLTDSLKVLHVAPEQIFFKKFSKISHWQYITTDLKSPLAAVKADICHLPFDTNTFDLIFCNHVLEHIPNDKKAMRELYRVLKKKGTAILQVPLEEGRVNTFEDNTITDKKERTRIFGQYDHVRIYGQDYYERLSKTGFEVSAVDVLSQLSKAERYRYGLKGVDEKIPIVFKM